MKAIQDSATTSSLEIERKIGRIAPLIDSTETNFLHDLAAKNDAKLLKMFLDAGADPNSQNCRGHPLLFTAIMGRHLEVTELLLNHPDINLLIPDDMNDQTAEFWVLSHLGNTVTSSCCSHVTYIIKIYLFDFML